MAELEARGGVQAVHGHKGSKLVPEQVRTQETSASAVPGTSAVRCWSFMAPLTTLGCERDLLKEHYVWCSAWCCNKLSVKTCTYIVLHLVVRL
jgi:hypothetical protein